MMHDNVNVALADAPAASETNGWMQRVDRLFEWLGDFLNPILIKEARQALKSRQFTLTFICVLLFGWGWSILGLAMLGPAAGVAIGGPMMFFGYYLILAFPLLVVVPFTAFRSLSSEREDRTFELLSITALRPWQIISGKLTSAILQMVVYLSALAPCLAFTYLLRGLDIISILMIVLYTALASLGLSVVSLLLATLTTERLWQVGLTVSVILGLFSTFWTALLIVGQVLSSGFWPLDDAEFWIFNAALLTSYVLYFALCFLSAAAQLGFPSSNHSTAVRVVMVLQSASLVGWFAGMLAYAGYDAWIVFMMLILGLMHWSVMGVFLTGESPTLSARVQRSLPQSFLGRALFTWFNPGPGTGYVFVVTNYLAIVLAGWTMIAGVRWFVPRQAMLGSGNGETESFLLGVVGTSYLLIYLGIGTLLIRLLSRLSQQEGVAIRTVLYTFLLLLGTVVPTVIQMMSPTLRSMNYTVIQVSNPFWTIIEIGSRSGFAMSFNGGMLLVVLPLAGVSIFVANLPSIAREVAFVRLASPARVAEEDAALAAALAPALPEKKSPWD